MLLVKQASSGVCKSLMNVLAPLSLPMTFAKST